jgi:hypothetical protein
MDPHAVIFEFIQRGNSVKVTAMDPGTLVEVSIVGPASAGQAALKTTALNKLKYVLAKRNQKNT